MSEDHAAGPGKVRLTVRLERADGQFVTSTTTVPDDLLDDTGMNRHVRHDLARDEAADGFSEAYRRLMELPE